MENTRRVQTAFRLDESLLNRLKRKAKRQNKSLKEDVRDEPVYPKVSFPIPHSARVSRMLDILPAFSEEELKEDDKLAYILGK